MEIYFLKELEPYSKEDLSKKLKLEESALNHYIVKFKSLNILKYDKAYKFTYVGLLQIEEKTIFFVPKYVKYEKDYSAVMKQILSLLNIYSQREKLEDDEIETLGSFQQHEYFNLISLIDFFLRDYFEYGLYSNEIVEYDWNGNGEINWGRTLEESTAYLIKGNAIYFNYLTNVVKNDEEDFIRKVHKYVLSECIEFLNRTGLIGYFNFPIFSFDITVSELGSTDFILDNIRNELNIQFNDRKQLVLNALYSFISNNGFKGQEDGLVIYGTRSFYHVWEKVCTFILGDEKNKKYKKMIDKPIWTDALGKPSEKDTLEPDIIKETDVFGNRAFIIFDAKYYTIYFNNGDVKNNPGVGDVTKQYFYELAYKDYLKKNGITQVYNLFLFPHDDVNISKLGKVSIEFLTSLKLQDITLLVLPAAEIFDLYIKSKKYTISQFENLLMVVNS